MRLIIWFMGKMMDRFVALKYDDKVQIMNMMADKMLNNISDEEKLALTKDISLKFFDLMIKYSSNSDRMALMSSMFSPEMVQKLVMEMAPGMIAASFKNMSGDEKQKMMLDMMPKPEDIEKQIKAMLPEILKGQMGGQEMPLPPRPPMLGRPLAPASAQPTAKPPAITKRVDPTDSMPVPSPKMGGMFRF